MNLGSHSSGLNIYFQTLGVHIRVGNNTCQEGRLLDGELHLREKGGYTTVSYNITGSYNEQ